MQRRGYQNALDKLTIAYFDRQTGWLSKSSDMLVALYPALLDDDAIINEGNLRFLFITLIFRNASAIINMPIKALKN